MTGESRFRMKLFMLRLLCMYIYGYKTEISHMFVNLYYLLQLLRMFVPG